MTQNHIARQIKCHGRVQGVFYRASTSDIAKQLSIVGWVKNMRDGTVLIHAEGTKENIDRLITWCHKGPMLASVTKVEAQDATLEKFNDFEVRYD